MKNIWNLFTKLCKWGALTLCAILALQALPISALFAADAAAPTEQVTTKADARETALLAAINQARADTGLSPLSLLPALSRAADTRARELGTAFSHTRPNGSNFSTALKEQNVSYRRAGENIAWGQKSPEEVMKAWMNSDGHRANILNPNFTKIGVGHYQNAKGTNYWAQLFTY